AGRGAGQGDHRQGGARGGRGDRGARAGCALPRCGGVRRAGRRGMAAGVPPPTGTHRAARRHGAATAAGRARPRAVVPQRMRRAAAVAVQPVGTDESRAQALARWQAIPLYIASEMANQREGLRLGYSAPQSNVRIVIRQLDQVLDQRLDRSPLYEPALRDSTPAFRDELRRFIENAILPTIRQYRQFLDKEYLPRARKVIGVSANPNGAACYKE